MALAELLHKVEQGWRSWPELFHHDHVFHRWVERLWQTQVFKRSAGSDPSRSRLPQELRGDFMRYLECRVEEALEDNSLLAMQWWYDLLERKPELEPAERMRRDFAFEFERHPDLQEIVEKLGVWGVYQAADLNDNERVCCDLHYLMGMSIGQCARYTGLSKDRVHWYLRSSRSKFADLFSPQGERWMKAVLKRYAMPAG